MTVIEKPSLTHERFGVIAVGDRVRVQWNGYNGVPKWATYEWGTVTGVGRTRWVVKLENHPAVLNVREDQIRQHEEAS